MLITLLPLKLPLGFPAGFSERALGSFLEQSYGAAFGVLLGVGDGTKAKELLNAWPHGVLFLVDPFIHLRRGYERPQNVDDATHQRHYDNLRSHFHDKSSVQGRYSFVREFSFSVPKIWIEKKWGPEPMMVFHDANPSYGAVRMDLLEWWPLLSEGGTFCGSNYTTEGDGSVVGVKLAVDEFAASLGLSVFVTDDEQEPFLLILATSRTSASMPTLEVLAFITAGLKDGKRWWCIMMEIRLMLIFFLMTVLEGSQLRNLLLLALTASYCLIEIRVSPWTISHNLIMNKSSLALNLSLLLLCVLGAWLEGMTALSDRIQNVVGIFLLVPTILCSVYGCVMLILSLASEVFFAQMLALLKAGAIIGPWTTVVFYVNNWLCGNLFEMHLMKCIGQVRFVIRSDGLKNV
eukprot:symbB.v1.2.000570.t4/scaffold3.1/size669525/10